MQLLTVVLLALSSVCLASPQKGLIGLEPLDSKLLTDLNQYIPAKRNKFNWEIKQKAKGTECACPEPQCPSYLNEASVSNSIAESDSQIANKAQLNQCKFNHATACFERSNGGCPKP